MEFIEIGIISEVRDDRARVKIGDMVTDFLPVIQLANSFARTFTPIRVGEQVVVLPVRGSLNSGVILRSIYQEAHLAPDTNEKEQICVFEDEVSISYNTNTSELVISSPKAVRVTTPDFYINGNLHVSGNIDDSRGDLTGHSHSDSDGYISTPR